MRVKICGKAVIDNRLEETAIYVENGKIVSIGESSLPFDQEYSVKDGYILPGFIDVHTHGAVGADYSEGTVEDILAAVRFQVMHGATSVMPTITSSTFERTYSALQNIEAAMQDKEYGACIVGAHLEGPYFSERQSGAQDPTLITSPIPQDYERITERFGHIIKRWDYAPEKDQNGEFCAFLAAKGILPSAGHTDAQYDDMLIARQNGCRLITHLYSCTSTIVREQGFRKLGVTECAYLWDDMFIEIIADGKHLPPELLQLIFKLKPHDKILLITDSMSVTGTKDTRGQLGNLQYIIEDNVCKLLDRSAFAGSIATAERLLSVCCSTGLPVTEVVKMGCETPASLFELCKGKLQVGYDADIVVVNKDYQVQSVFLKGEQKK